MSSPLLLRDNRHLRRYNLYGLCLKSEWPLPSSNGAKAELEVELYEGAVSLFRQALTEANIESKEAEWFCHARLGDGIDYLRWSGLFEFLISDDGRRIACHSFDDVSCETFQTYLLGQVLSFALVKRGLEPLHSTAVVIDGEAVGLIGNTGYGKSTLAAAFLKAGHLLLTDDLLVLKESNHRSVAYPGPPRIKLFPEVAKIFLGERVSGALMNPYTQKLIVVLGPSQFSRDAKPLRAIYVLGPPTAIRRSDRIVIRRLRQRQAFLEVIRNTFNTAITAPERLTRQFGLAARLVAGIPVKSLSYPRDLSRLPEVVEAIQSDLTR